MTNTFLGPTLSVEMQSVLRAGYGVLLALVRNSKTPVAITLNLMSRLIDSDVKKLASDRNVPEALRLAARKRNVKIQTGGG